jgi:DegV family protein with EDD domain
MNDAERGRVAVVTDSTADLPPEWVAQHAIHVVPQILIAGDKTWRDGVDIDSPAFYQLLRTSKDFPRTSQPSIASFAELFSTLSGHATGIVAVLVSGGLSGTVNSALTAASNLPDLPIEIVDTGAVSMQLGFAVLAAAQAAEAGADIQAVAAAARTMIPRTGIFFVVDTLEYLHRNGRIGAAAMLFGSALNLKPLLSIQGGIVTPVAKIRSRRNALDKMIELMQQQVPPGKRIHLAVLHVAAPEDAAHLRDDLVSRFDPIDVLVAECGPVIGAHAGPGTLGAAFYVD